MKDYPAPVMVTLLGNSFTSILATAVALILERDPNAWKLRSDIELVTIVYAVSTCHNSFRPHHGYFNFLVFEAYFLFLDIL